MNTYLKNEYPIVLLQVRNGTKEGIFFGSH